MTTRIRGLTDRTSRNSTPSSTRGKQTRTSVLNMSAVKCVKCSGDHLLAKCHEFLSKTVEQRQRLAKQFKCCFNCLRPGHYPKNCTSKGRCNRCRRAHHSLLHFSSTGKVGGNLTQSTYPLSDSHNLVPSAPIDTDHHILDNASASVQTVQAANMTLLNFANVLLATAWITFRTPEGREFKLRALLDQGSTFSFISESLCQTMLTRRYRSVLQIRGFGDKYSGVAKHCVRLTLSPCNNRVPIRWACL